MSTAQRFRKKPVEIKAMQYAHPPDAEKIVRWMGGGRLDIDGGSGKILIRTLEGTMTASPGDWIIKGVQGEFYPCKPDIFEETYEPVSEMPS